MTAHPVVRPCIPDHRSGDVGSRTPSDGQFRLNAFHLVFPRSHIKPKLWKHGAITAFSVRGRMNRIDPASKPHKNSPTMKTRFHRITAGYI